MSTSPLESQIINLLSQETTKQLTVKQISKYLGKDLGNISRKVNNLVKNGTLKKSQFRTGDRAHAQMFLQS
jgi:predicted transcriptional regulator